MNMFSAMWTSFMNLFRDHAPTNLDPVPVETPEGPAPAADLEDISEVPSDAVDTEATCHPTPVEVELSPRQLTANFHIDEFACNDGTPVPEELYENVLELAENLQILRDALGKPFKIMSGYRHPEYNKKIGGARKSQHMTASAADIKVKGVGPAKLADLIEESISRGDMKSGGVGRYPTFTHYDTRGRNARWGGTRTKN